MCRFLHNARTVLRLVPGIRTPLDIEQPGVLQVLIIRKQRLLFHGFGIVPYPVRSAVAVAVDQRNLLAQPEVWQPSTSSA